MDSAITLQNVANIVTFVAPGYFLLQTYAIIYAKRERNFSRLLIESAIFSLPLVSVANLLWEHVMRQPHVTTLNSLYALFVISLSLLAGVIVSFLRVRRPVKPLAARLGLSVPDEDFVRAQFARLRRPSDVVTVTLKSGAVFSGTPESGSIYQKDRPKRFYFTNLAWAQDDNTWEERTGGLIVDLSEVEYIETPKLKNS